MRSAASCCRASGSRACSIPACRGCEISNIAGYLLDTPDEAKSIAGSTIFSGIGFIRGVRCVVVVDDSGIQAGAMTSGGGYRLRRAQEIALQQNMPFVHLVESAGGDLLNYKVEGFVSGGALFANLARLSAKGMPVISLLHGSSTAGGAYMPGLSDYVVAVKGRGRAFLAGPPLLKAATGEIATEEELGGADMHATVSGLAEYLAEDDAEACMIGREVVGRLGWNRHCPAPPPRKFSEPTLDPGRDRRHRAGRLPHPLRCARSDRAHRRRLGLLRFQAGLWRLDSLRRRRR